MDPEPTPASEKILVAVDDMFFAAKILSTANHLGRAVERVKTAEQLIESVKTERPALLIIDLNSAQFDALALIKACKSQPALSAMRILGFLSHVQTELKGLAESAGCDLVMPRSAFSQTMADILSGKLPNSSAKRS